MKRMFLGMVTIIAVVVILNAFPAFAQLAPEATGTGSGMTPGQTVQPAPSGIPSGILSNLLSQRAEQLRALGL